MHRLRQQEQQQEQRPPQRRPARQRLLDDVEILVAGGGPPGKQGLESRLRAARNSGSLNLACMDLAAVPVAALSPFDHLGADEKAWEIVELTKVDMSMNELQSLPPEVSNWAPSLRVLLCRQNHLTTLPRELFSLSALTTADLSSNGLVSFADQNPSLLKGLTALKELNLRSNQLRELPTSLGALSALESLDVSGNKLAHLPASIGQLARLQTLIANNNCLEALPPPLLSLASLRLLDVRKNKITEGDDGLPLSLVQMRSLSHLDLRENRLSFAPTPLPPGVLSQLYLGNNRISCLPPQPAAWFASMATSLAELDLQGNALTELPLEIAFCQKLKLLDVSNNELRDIAFTLGFLPDLKRVLLEGNPLRTLRRSLFSAPISELQKFLRTRGDPPAWLLALEDGKDAMTLAAELEGDAPAPIRSMPAAPAPPRAAGRINLTADRHIQESTPITMIAPPQPRTSQPEPPPPLPQEARAASNGAVALDQEIAQLEEALEALGLTKGKEQILKRELALKRAQRSRLRASLG